MLLLASGWHLLDEDHLGVVLILDPRVQDLADAAWRHPVAVRATHDRHALLACCQVLGILHHQPDQHGDAHLLQAIRSAPHDRPATFRVPHHAWPSLRLRIADRLALRHAPATAAPAASILGDIDDTVAPRCRWCHQPQHLAPDGSGNHRGHGTTLRKNLLDDEAFTQHPWYLGPRSLAAHHLICSEAMQQEPWPALCADFGYDINNATNGLLLPTRMDAACQLTVARHAGNHDDTIGDGDLSYIDTIKAELRQIAQEAQAGIYCRQRNPLTWRLHILSRKAAVRIRTFTWTVTSDGLDYQPGGIGCAGATSLDKKSTQPCPCHRDHDLVGPDRNPLTPGSIP